MYAGRDNSQIISLLNIEKLYRNQDIDEQVYALFHGHCHRIMRKAYGTDVPFCEETILRMKDGFFWSELIKEVIETKNLSPADLAREFGSNCSFIENIIAREKYNFEMPLSMGRSLLKIHNKLVPPKVC